MISNIEMWTKTNSSGQFTLTLSYWENNNSASKDTTLPSTQAFLSLPYTCGENEKLEIWRIFFFGKIGNLKCDFYSVILLMYLVCAMLYRPITVD